MIGRAGQWTQTPSTTPLQLKTWNACFCITFNIWCWPGCSMDSHPICHPLPPKKWNAHFWITFNFWWLAGLVDGLKPQPPPLFSQKMKSSFLDYIQLLMIGQAGQWTRTPSATPLQPKKWNAHFWITFTLDDWPGWSMDSNPIHHPSPANKMKCFFLDYVHYWWSARLVNGLKPICHPSPAKKNEMLLFGLCSTSDDWLGWLMDSNPIHHPSPPRKMKCSFLDYVQLLMIGWAARLTWTPSTTPLHPKTWNACLCITFNIWCWPDWSMDSNPICHPL